jgi:hypothetical protein
MTTFHHFALTFLNFKVIFLTTKKYEIGSTKLFASPATVNLKRQSKIAQKVKRERDGTEKKRIP